MIKIFNSRRSRALGRIKRLAVLIFFLSGVTAVGAPVWASSRTDFEEGWKWYEHRRERGADQEELTDILQRLRKKYVGSGLDLSKVDRELERHKSPERSTQEGFDDGWKWYKHRRSRGADDYELKDILKTLEKKYAGTSVNLSGVRRELSRFEAPALDITSLPGVPPPPATSGRSLSGPEEKQFQQAVSALEHSDPKVRLKAVEILKEMKDPRSVNPLVARLGDSDRFVSIVAANALVNIGEPSLQPLLQALNHDDLRVRLVACVALGDMGNPVTVPYLEKASRDDSSEVRQSARHALTKIKDRQSREKR